MTATQEGRTLVRRRGAVIVPNETIYDSSISYAALGLLAILLARPEDAPQGYRTLMRPGVGQKAILSAFKELREAGYRYQFLRSVPQSVGRPKLVTDTYVSDKPISLEEAKRWHFDSTGEVAYEKGEREAQRKAGEEAATKGTLASLSAAHKDAAHSSAAHSRAAQSKSFPVPQKNTEENSTKGEPDEGNETEARLELRECNVCHYYYRPTCEDDATTCGGCNKAAERAARDLLKETPPAIGPNRARVRAMLDASRSPRAVVERAKAKSSRDDSEPPRG